MRSLVLLVVAVSLMACGGSYQPASGTRAAASYPQFADRDPHEWDQVKPWHYPVHGIDVSRWQGEIDWRRVRASGVGFAFIKATEGGDVVDPKFPDNWAGARQAGLSRGAYHYFYFCRPAREQARWFISHVPRERGAMPPVLDMEWNHLSRTCPHRPSPEVVRSEIAEFSQVVARHYGQRPVIYTTVDFYRDNGLDRVRGQEFWLRSVAGHPSVTYPDQHWTFWQYTGTGRVDGIVGDADINVFAGTMPQWRDWVSKRAN